MAGVRADIGVMCDVGILVFAGVSVVVVFIRYGG